MPDVDLYPLDADALALLSEAPERFAEREGLELGEQAETVRGIARASATYYAARPAGETMWGGYLAVDRATRAVIGTCAYKGPPDGDGAVEIAYFTFPAFERRGYATAMATELQARALGAPAVRMVLAHTLRERNASARLLHKLGFAGPVDADDPEDGPVWRWEWRR